MTGYYRMARGWLNHPALGGDREPFCRRAAWCWLIEHAVWRPMSMKSPGRHMPLDRAQLSYSTRFLAKVWKWSEPAVRRFLRRLRAHAMIEVTIVSGQMLITIVNYDRYQADAPTDAAADAAADAPEAAETLGFLHGADAPTDAAPVTQPTQIRKKGKKEGEKEPSFGRRGCAASPDKIVYDLGKRVLGQKSGGIVRKLIDHHGGDMDAALRTLERAAGKSEPRAYVGGILRGATGPRVDDMLAETDRLYREWGVS